MSVLVITRGLPASGKTTYAKAWVNAARTPGDRVRVNRDEMRKNLFDAYWGLSYEQETTVTVAQHAAIEALLRTGHDVIVDDTNLKLKHAKALAKIAVDTGGRYRVVDFTDVGVELCVLRDLDRRGRGERAVGEEVIRNMHARYLGKGSLDTVDVSLTPESIEYLYEPNTSLPKAWLVDIDGTLAHSNGRGPFEWKRVGEDDLDEKIAAITRMLYVNDDVVLMSGRDESCREETMGWLRQHNVEVDAVLMRRAGDTRKDAIVKRELFIANVAPFWNVQAVFDDRDQVVAMWRSIGLPCFQVAPGAF